MSLEVLNVGNKSSFSFLNSLKAFKSLSTLIPKIKTDLLDLTKSLNIKFSLRHEGHQVAQKKQ